MGKGKRSRENNAADLFNAAAESKNTKKRSGSSANVWTKVLLIVVALIIVASTALTYIGTSGILLRAPKAFKSENFEINGAMMQYIFSTQYTNLSSNYKTQLQGIGFKTDVGLRDQNFTATGSTFLNTLYGDDLKTSGTWFDVFWEIAKTQAKQTLAYCEAAKASGITLTEEDHKTIDQNLDAIDTMATLYGFPNTSSYIKAMYGSSVTKKDIRNVMELTELSAKFYEKETDRIFDAITDEQVKAFFEEHKSDYLYADFYTLTFQAVKDAAGANDKDEDKKAKEEKFKADVEAVKKHAEAVSAMTDIEEIKEYMTAYWAEDYYDAYLRTTEDELKKNDKETGKPTITKDDIPTDEAVLAANKDKVIAAVKDAVKNETADADLKDMGETAYDKVLTSLRNKLISKIRKDLEAMLSEEISYNESNDDHKWIFSEDRKANDTNTVTPKTFDATKDNTYKVTVYRIEKPRYILEEKVKEFGHILINDDNFEKDSHEGHDHAATDKDAISKENDAKAKAEADRLLAEFLKGNKTKEAFEALAKDKNQDSNVFYADTKPGTMVEEMDEFLFSKETKVNDTKVIKTTYGYHVTWLVSEGKEIWFVDSKADLEAELLEKWDKEILAKYAVTDNKNLTKIANRIDA